jgi:hypothetical protein
MLRPGHPSPSFRWSCQRQRGDLNRAGTLDKPLTNSKASTPGDGRVQRQEQVRRPPQARPRFFAVRLGLRPRTRGGQENNERRASRFHVSALPFIAAAACRP